MLLALALSGSFGACAQNDPQESLDWAPSSYSTPWRVDRVIDQQRLRIAIPAGHCRGGPLPEIEDIKVVETSKAVFIGVVLNSRERALGGTFCPGKVTVLHGEVVLGAPLGGRRLFDTSRDPLERRRLRR